MSRPADPRRRPAAVLALVAGGVGLTVALAVPAAATAGTESWAPEIALAGGDDPGVELVDGTVRPSETGAGELLLAPRRTAGPVSAVSAEPAVATPAGSSVVVEVRGLRTDGRWGPWVTVPREGDAPLDAPSAELSVRVLLRRGADGATPVLRGLWLTATHAAPPRTTPSTTTETTTVTTTVPVTLVPTTTTTTTSTTTTPPPSSTTTSTTTSTTEPTTTTTSPTSTTTTEPETTEPETTEPETTEPETTEPETTEPDTTTTTPVPPPGLVLDLPPDPPYVPSPPATPATSAEVRTSWWGDLLAWLGRAL